MGSLGQSLPHPVAQLGGENAVVVKYLHAEVQCQGRFFGNATNQFWLRGWILLRNLDELHALESSPGEVGGWPGCQRGDGISTQWIKDMLKMKSAANVRQQKWRMNTGKSELNKLNQKMRDWLKL